MGCRELQRGERGWRDEVLGAALRDALLSPSLHPTPHSHLVAQKLHLVSALPLSKAHAGMVGWCGSEVDVHPQDHIGWQGRSVYLPI